VTVPSLGTEGEVVALSDEGVDVQLGALRARLAYDQVRLRSKAQPAAAPPAGSIKLPAAESPGVEVHLRGMRADEALETTGVHRVGATRSRRGSCTEVRRCLLTTGLFRTAVSLILCLCYRRRRAQIRNRLRLALTLK
jgi:hypothetical protein